MSTVVTHLIAFCLGFLICFGLMVWANLRNPGAVDKTEEVIRNIKKE